VFSEVDERHFLFLIVNPRYSPKLFVETEIELVVGLARFPVESSVTDVVFQFRDGVVCPVLKHIICLVVCLLPIWSGVDVPVLVKRYSVSIGSVIGVELVPSNVNGNLVRSRSIRVSAER